MEINERFTNIRNSLKMKKNEYANFLGIAPTLVSDIESGKREVSKDILMRLSERQHINIHWLLTGVGEPFLTEKKEIKHPLVEEIEKAIEKETHTRFELIESQLDLLKKQIESLRAYLPHEQGNTEIGS